MTRDMNHDRCSELLGDYVRGELPAAEAQQVETHLQACELCASEHRAISALLGAEPIPLSEIERARMRRIVLAEPVPDADQASPMHPVTDDRGARLFRLLGAAAVAVALAVFAYSGLGDFGGSEDAAMETVEVDEEQADDDAAGGGEADAGRSAAQEAAPEGADMLQEERTADEPGSRVESAGSTANRFAPPGPTFEPSMGRVDRKRLNHLGRRGAVLVAFSQTFQVRDVERLRDEFVDELADAAPSARGAQIRECAAPITSNFPTALPAYSAIADYTDRPRREVLIVAFVWTPEPQGPLDQSMVWAWPLDTCDQVAHYSKNVIEPRR